MVSGATRCNILPRASTILVRTDDGGAIAAFRAGVRVECVVGIADVAETNVSPPGPALDAELAGFDGAFERHCECVSEQQSHGGDESKGHVGGELHGD